MIVATPHVADCADPARIRAVAESCRSFREEVAAAGLNVEILPGAELVPSVDLSDAIRSNPLLTLGGFGRYVLLEFPTYEIPLYAEEVIFELAVRGTRTILAHPERYAPVQEDPDMLTRFLDRGVLLQMNAGSAEGRYGRRAARTARRLLKAGLFHIIASDTHGLTPDDYPLGNAVELAGQIVGRQKAMDMVFTNPARILGER
jgi:protein-tyrosine phosphatase